MKPKIETEVLSSKVLYQEDSSVSVSLFGKRTRYGEAEITTGRVLSTEDITRFIQNGFLVPENLFGGYEYELKLSEGSKFAGRKVRVGVRNIIGVDFDSPTSTYEVGKVVLYGAKQTRTPIFHWGIIGAYDKVTTSKATYVKVYFKPVQEKSNELSALLDIEKDKR